MPVQHPRLAARQRLRTVSVLACLTALAASSVSPAAAVDSPQALTMRLTAVGPTFTKPVLITHAGDGTGRLFVVQQNGYIKVRTSGGTWKTFLNIASKVSTGSEQGLLGLAFHPSFETNGKFYVNFTNLSGDTRVVEYRAERGVAVTSSARVLLTIDQPYANHNGGMLAFRPQDGAPYLYVSTGDGGSAGDPGNRAQSLNSLLGKILRINPDARTGTKPYGIPSTNPYAASAGLDEIWSRGLRNPWRFSFDRGTGYLWIGDVGQGRYEEVDRSATGRAVNYGWRVYEGKHCYKPATGCSLAGDVFPVLEYNQAGNDRCAVTGGYVYRGPSAALVNRYVYADYCTGEIWSVPQAGPYTATRHLDTAHYISSFGEDESGNLYVASLYGGRIYRITATS